MSHETAPDPAMTPEGERTPRPQQENPYWAHALVHPGAVNGALLEPWFAECSTTMEDRTLADDLGMRWAGLLAAFIHGMHSTTPIDTDG